MILPYIPSPNLTNQSYWWRRPPRLKKWPQQRYMAERNLEISPMKVVFHWRLFSIEGRPPSKGVLHRRSSSIKSRLQSQRSSSIEGRLHWSSSSIKGRLPSLVDSIIGCLPWKVIFHRRSSSIKWRPPSKFVFHWRLSSIEGCLPSKDAFHRRSSSIEGLLPLNVVFHQRSSSIKGRLPSKVVFHRRSSSIEGRLP